MKKLSIAIVITAGSLFLTGCGSSAPAAKDGVATSDQMGSIDKVARAMASEKYNDAFSAGFYTFGSSGEFTQNAGAMANDRKRHEDVWNEVKADFDKGCTLVADKMDSSRGIHSNVACNGESKPVYEVVVQYLSDKFAYIEANRIS